MKRHIMVIVAAFAAIVSLSASAGGFATQGSTIKWVNVEYGWVQC